MNTSSLPSSFLPLSEAWMKLGSACKKVTPKHIPVLQRASSLVILQSLPTSNSQYVSSKWACFIDPQIPVYFKENSMLSLKL